MFEKEAIALEALKVIKSGQSIFLDSGTSTLQIAHLIPEELNSVFVTNSLNIALELMRKKITSVIMIGGDLDVNTNSSRGAMAEEQQKIYMLTLLFSDVMLFLQKERFWSEI